jgi:DnaK suppressor protein
LGRIDDGTYGVCATCGEDIAVARLSAMPATLFCVRCAD